MVLDVLAVSELPHVEEEERDGGQACFRAAGMAGTSFLP